MVRHGCVQATHGRHNSQELRGAQGALALRAPGRAGGVQVLPHGALEEVWLLGDDGHRPAPQPGERHPRDIAAVDAHLAAVQADHAQDGEHARGLPGAGAAYESGPLPWEDLEGDAAQHKRQVRPVAELHVLKHDLPVLRPRSRRLLGLLVGGRLLLRDAVEVLQALDRREVVLRLDRCLHALVEPPQEAGPRREAQTHQGWVHGVAEDDGHRHDDEHQVGAQHVDAVDEPGEEGLLVQEERRVRVDLRLELLQHGPREIHRPYVHEPGQGLRKVRVERAARDTLEPLQLPRGGGEEAADVYEAEEEGHRGQGGDVRRGHAEQDRGQHVRRALHEVEHELR
mmetsp:Transcript_18302/g.55229  ORF Transcript_18302/g.55229 Transcript_18302/m.55229 type:complete len:341 (-) Transcript_18302:1287-2309(-)